MKVKGRVLLIVLAGLGISILGLSGCGKSDCRPVVKVDKLETTLKKKFGTSVDYLPREKQLYPYQYLYTGEGLTFRRPEARAYITDHPKVGDYPGDAVMKSSIGGAGYAVLYVASDNPTPDPKYLRTE